MLVIQPSILTYNQFNLLSEPHLKEIKTNCILDDQDGKQVVFVNKFHKWFNANLASHNKRRESRLSPLINIDSLEKVESFFNCKVDTSSGSNIGNLTPVFSGITPLAQGALDIYLYEGYQVINFVSRDLLIFEPKEAPQYKDKDPANSPDVTKLFKGELLELYHECPSKELRLVIMAAKAIEEWMHSY